MTHDFAAFQAWTDKLSKLQETGRVYQQKEGVPKAIIKLISLLGRFNYARTHHIYYNRDKAIQDAEQQSLQQTRHLASQNPLPLSSKLQPPSPTEPEGARPTPSDIPSQLSPSHASPPPSNPITEPPPSPGAATPSPLLPPPPVEVDQVNSQSPEFVPPPDPIHCHTEPPFISNPLPILPHVTLTTQPNSVTSSTRADAQREKLCKQLAAFLKQQVSDFLDTRMYEQTDHQVMKPDYSFPQKMWNHCYFIHTTPGDTTGSSPKARRPELALEAALVRPIARTLSINTRDTKPATPWNLYFTTRPQNNLVATILCDIDPLPQEQAPSLNRSSDTQHMIELMFSSIQMTRTCYDNVSSISFIHPLFPEFVPCTNLPIDCLAKRLERLSEQQLQKLILRLLHTRPILPDTKQEASGPIDLWRPVELFSEVFANKRVIMEIFLLELFVEPTNFFLSDYLSTASSKGFLYAIRRQAEALPIAYLFGYLHNTPRHLSVLPDYVYTKYQSCHHIVLASPPSVESLTHHHPSLLYKRGDTLDIEQLVKEDYDAQNKQILYLETSADREQRSFSYSHERETIAWKLGDQQLFAELCTTESDALYKTSSRTQQWMTKIPRWLASSSENAPYFMLVGAAHLFDHGANKGLCSLLEENGFSVTREME